MEQCMDEKLGMKKPPFGYFTQLRVHETERPKPKSAATEFKNPTVGFPKDFAKDFDSPRTIEGI